MKKFILLTALICGFLVSNSQSYTYIAQRYRWLAGLFEALGLPAGDSAQFKPGQRQQAGAVYYDSTGSDAGMYLWTGTAWVLQGTPAAAELPDGLISGGYVTYSGSGLKFYISPAVYRINGVIYGTAYDSVTLATADPDDPRKDVIYLATTGVEVLTGTPAGPAAEPQMEAGQIKLTVVDIQAGASVPTLTTNIIYDENTGESTVTNVGTTTDPDNTEDPYHLTKAVEFTNVDNLDAGIFTLPSTVDITTYEGISMFLRLKGVMHSTARIYVTFGNGSNWISNEVQVTMNKNSLTYQGLTVPMSLFTFTNAFVDKVRIRWYQSSPVVHPGFYLDYVHWESGVQQPGGGSTPMTVGAIGSKLPSPNGAVIENNVFYQQPASQTYPGLLSAADKTKLDSLRSDYLMENVGDGEELATQVNDSTVGIKSLKAGTGVTLASTDTTVTINATAGAQTLQQTFDQEVGGSVLTKIDTISTNNTIKIIGSTTSFAELLRVENSSTTGGGIVASTAGTNTTIRAINNKTSSGGGTAILGETYGSNATGALTRDSSSTATVIKVLDLNRTTSGSAANGIGAAIHFNVENSSANTFFANSVESIWKNSIDANKESMLRIRGVNNTVEEVYMDIQKGGIVIVNNGADTLATQAYARSFGGGGGGISLTTTGSSGPATLVGTVLNIPEYDNSTGTYHGTSFSATSTSITSSAVQWTFTGSSPATFTLPARTSSVNQFYTIKNIGSADLTVAADGTDDIFTTSSVSSLTVVPGGSVMITGAANGTSDLWTALFHTTGSAPIDTAYLRRAGNGTQIAYTDNDTLFLKDLIGEDFITVDTKTDSTTRVRLDTASAGLKSYIAANSSGGSTISVSSSWFVDTLKINGAAASWSTRPDVIYDEFLSAQNTASGSLNTSELAIGTGTDASIGNTLGSIPSTWHGVMVFQTGSTATGLAAIATTSTTQARLYVDTTKKYRFETVVRLPVLSAAADSFRVTAGFTVYTTNYTVASNDIHFRYSHGHNSGAWTCYNNNTGGSGQATNTAVTVAANTDYKLGIEFDGEQILFYINDVLEATHTTALPAQGTSMLFPVVAITKTGGTTGTTNMFMYADWIKYRKL